MTIYGLVFGHLVFPPFLVMVRYVRDKASVRPRISYDVIMYVVIKGGVFEFIGHGRMKNWILLCEFRQ